MPYCTRCGGELPKDARFCPKCGMDVKNGAEAGVEESIEVALEKAGEQFVRAFDQAGEAVRRAFSRTEVRKDEFEVSGSELVEKVNALIREGNIRRVIIRDQEGRTLMEFPLTVGVIGVVLAPILAALGAIATLAMKYTIIVERKQEE